MKTLAKKDINKILSIWAQKHEVLAPTKMDNGDCIFSAFDEKAFTLDYKKPPLSPKSVLFPQSEIIFRVEKNKYNEVVAAKKTMIFGLRSCDMMGIRQASSFMSRDNEDIYYQARQNAAATVVMACPKAQNETCFCTTTLSGPVAKKGFDLQLYDIGDTLLVEVGSSRGEELLAGMPLAEMEESKAKQKIDEFLQNAILTIPEVKSVIDAMNKLKDRKVPEKVWDDFGAKCITCGGCAFVCPTCTCFNVYDHQRAAGEGVRLRSWDACLYSGFTREASGHNPRIRQASRLKRRHEHKLLDYNNTDIQDGLCGCVGCGRCSDYCPVHIGTLEVVKSIAG